MRRLAPRDVPYVDLAGQHAPLADELLAAAATVIRSGQFIGGELVERFEAAFADLCEVPYAIGCNSGTDALVLSLRALGIGPGDEVITAPNSFVASASCIAMVGARPVFVDVRDDFNLDAGQVAAAITSRTRAILPVHLTGRPAPMDPLLAVARRHQLAVIEDAAQAVGARYRDRPVGSLGDLGCFSLHPLKTLNACGDGGVITCRDPALAERLRVLRNLGLETRDRCVAWSGNSRLDALQAALLLVKLPHLARWTEARQDRARRYRLLLHDAADLVLPMDRPYEFAVYHTFVIQAPRRDWLREQLAARGIGTAVHYPTPLHLQPAAAGLGYQRGAFPVAERQAERILSLPVHQGVTGDDVSYVADVILSLVGELESAG